MPVAEAKDAKSTYGIKETSPTPTTATKANKPGYETITIGSTTAATAPKTPAASTTTTAAKTPAASITTTAAKTPTVSTTTTAAKTPAAITTTVVAKPSAPAAKPATKAGK